MKIWTEGVSKAEVEAEISAFFQALRRGDLKLARSSVTHHSDDWEHQIWSLWQDTWLIVLEDRDEDVALLHAGPRPGLVTAPAAHAPTRWRHRTLRAGTGS